MGVISLGFYKPGEICFRRWETELRQQEHKALATLARDKFNRNEAFQEKR